MVKFWDRLLCMLEKHTTESAKYRGEREMSRLGKVGKI